MAKPTTTPLKIAAWASFGLAGLKFAAYLMTGSLVVLSSFFDSFVDCVTSFINHRVQALARKRPDREHPFGHGGFEVVSSLIQGTLIMLSGSIVIYQAIDRLLHPEIEPAFSNEDLLYALGALLISAISGALIQSYLHRHESKLHKNRQRSLALSSDRAHYLADFWFNLCAMIGIAVVWYTGIVKWDAIFAIIGALLLVKAAVPILWQCSKDILHTEVDAKTQQAIVDTILQVDPNIKGIHRLRTRQLGPTQFVDFHLKLPSHLPLHTAHELGDKVTRSLKKKFPQIDVIIHLDPENEPDDELWAPSYET